jgi:hypothetical protein
MNKKISIALLAIIALVGGYFLIHTNRLAEDITFPTETTTATSTHSPDMVNAKINIDAICQGALSYMTFPDGQSADVFVQECKEGKHPEVIERYKAEIDLGDGAAI